MNSLVSESRSRRPVYGWIFLIITLLVPTYVFLRYLAHDLSGISFHGGGGGRPFQLQQEEFYLLAVLLGVSMAMMFFETLRHKRWRVIHSVSILLNILACYVIYNARF